MAWFSRLGPKSNLLRAPTMATIQVQKTIGWKIRDAVGYVEELLGPYVKKIIPSFVAAHYVYIFTFVIIGSIIMYPVKDAPYIDVLFFASGSSTQAGLNTIDLNAMKLYQQITIYLVCMMTTPIFIHGSVCLLRLYWFERHFDNIRAKSKLNFKMRRTATMAARTQSMARSRSVESLRRERQGRQQQQQQQSPSIPQTSTTDSPEDKPGDSSSSISRVSQQSPMQFTESAMNLHRDQINSDDIHHVSEPSSEDEGNLPPDARHVNVIGDEDESGSPDGQSNIKFGALPKPKREDFEPKDVMMSIAMMQNNRTHTVDQSDDDEAGPALVIKGPAEREPPSRKNSSIQFNLKPAIHKRKRSGIRRSFMRNNSNTLVNLDSALIDEIDDNDATNEVTDHAMLQRAQSHLQLPSSDLSGVKFVKRSNTMDLNNDEEVQIGSSPTFAKFKSKLTKNGRGLRRRLSSNAVDDTSELFDGSETEDDEEGEEDEDGNRLGRQMSANYLSWTPTVGRNSTFVNLSDQQKEELGGVEYRAVKLLIKIIIAYYVGFHILSFVFLLPWILHTHRYQAPVTASGVSLTWWGFFTSASAFNDLGYTLTPDSMISFKTSPYALLVMGFFVVIGNTGFPVLLRFIIWVMFKFSKDLSQFQESLGFLLDHPRRCFTLLFPSGPTWWLFFILVLLNVVDLVLFIILDLNATVVEELSTGQKILDGLFQAISTRTAGFACVDLSQLHPAIQVSYMVMMYISVLPLAISIRRTNVYEEQSLGMYGGHKEDHEADEMKPTSFIGAHLRKQLSFDLWFVFMGLFIICIAEGSKIQDPLAPAFNVFSCMFEVVSAYGTVGLSLGYPNTNQSFSGRFTVLSKLVIIAMMIRGRHRGLPYSLDRAIMLPSTTMEQRDRYQDLHAGQHLNRTETMGSSSDPVLEFFKSAAPKVIRDHIKRPSIFSHKPANDLSPRGHQRSSLSQISQESNRQQQPQRENSTDYFSHRPAADKYSFKQIPKHTQSGQNEDPDLSPIDTVSSAVELQNLGRSESYTFEQDGEPVHRAETEFASESADIVERSNSTNTV